ncbi:MAG: SapC family protein [Zoogloea oleivorans]|uniref:SapC family protein n=1 Tax=Zoogloea oleivorans TaxID=1552750 RepID=UPI002A36CA8B|nr:SapC family protein [Zoogloea oleivorans]MDY0036814.1 SapC family protein [Zoogloea oleivorans]
MFKDLTALTRDQHQDLRFTVAKGYAFASSLMVSPVMLGEAALVARDIPVLFSRSDGMPIALLGLKPGQNAYVDMQDKRKGKWLARYVPAHIRRYPFMLAEQQVGGETVAGKRTFTFMADLAAPHFADPKGERLFDDQGQPTATLTQIQKVLMDLQRAHVRTQRCVQQLLENELLIDRALKAQTELGKTLALEGMKVVDSRRLHALSPEKLAALQQSGALGLIHAHLMSLNNLNEAPLRTSEGLAPLAVAMESGTLSFSGLR